jgi:hypothetical protein
LLAVLLCIGCPLVVGCGSASTPRKVQVSLSAPTDGATVAVSRIEVLGTVAPENSAVRVGGKRVPVAHGAFKAPISLRRGLTRIRIEARANGLGDSSTIISVRYSPPQRSAAASTGAPATGVSSPQPQSTDPGAGDRSLSGLTPTARAEAISRCTATSGGNTSACTCLFDHLFKAGFNAAYWQAVVRRWRRSLSTTGQITFPRIMIKAAQVCAKQLHGQ